MSVTPTEEQNSIVDWTLTGENLRVNAYAGAAKSTTLVLASRANVKPSLYITFNKTMSDEAKTMFPSHVEVRTSHSLAYKFFGDRLSHKLQRPFGHYVNVCGTGSEIARYFKLAPIFVADKTISPAMLGYSILNTVRNFEHSAEEELKIYQVSLVGLEKFHKMKAFNPKTYKNLVLEYAKKLWELRIDENSNILCSHDTYMKLFQLSKPILSGYDIIYLDEAQDTNPCLLDIFTRQKCQLIMVGDEFQSIYGFRGAVNAMKEVNWKTLSLSKSFRFGEEVADCASKLLFGVGGVIKGFEKVDTKLSPVNSSTQHTKIFRTNSALLEEGISLLSEGKNVLMDIDSRGIISMIESCIALREGNKKAVKHVDFISYEDWEEFVSVVNIIGEPEVKRVYMIVEDGRGEEFILALKDYVKPINYDIELTTAHKMKGLEREVVEIANDFYFEDLDNIPQQEINLLYVAATRAKKVLSVNKTIIDIISNKGSSIKVGEVSLINGKDYKGDLDGLVDSGVYSLFGGSVEDFSMINNQVKFEEEYLFDSRGVDVHRKI